MFLNILYRDTGAVMNNQPITFHLLIWTCCSLLAISEWLGIHTFFNPLHIQTPSSESIPHALMATLSKLNTLTPGFIHISALQCQLETCTLKGELKSNQAFSYIQNRLKTAYQCHITSSNQDQKLSLTCQKSLTQLS